MIIKKMFAMVFVVTMLASCNQNPKEEDVVEEDVIEEKELTEAEKIAYAYGFENWKNVEEIKFAFNVGSADSTMMTRHWRWHPKSGDVRMITATDTVEYNRASIDSTNMNADRGFINDKYWLLKPFQLVWDEGTTLSTPVVAMAPMDSTSMKKLTITYGSEGGYTPGDAYDLYYDDDYKIKEWVFRRGNDSVPSMIAGLENEETLKGITITKDHNLMGSDRKIFFTDVEITTSEN